MLEHVAEYHARVKSDLLVLVTLEGREEDLLPPTQILDRRPARAYLAPQQVREALHDVLARLELEARERRHQGE